MLLLKVFCLSAMLIGCNNPAGNTQLNLPAGKEIMSGPAQLYGETSLSTKSICCDTASNSSDNLFTYGRCISLPELNGNSVAIAGLNNRISSDYKSLVLLCGNEITDQENFLKTGYQYFLDDSLLSLVIETQNAWHLSEGTLEYNVYHYDLKNNRIMNTRAMLEAWGMSQVPLLNAISEQVTMPPGYTEPLFQHEWFEIVKWKDINQLKVFKNSKEQLVIIYPVAENGIEAMQTIE